MERDRLSSSQPRPEQWERPLWEGPMARWLSAARYSEEGDDGGLQVLRKVCRLPAQGT